MRTPQQRKWIIVNRRESVPPRPLKVKNGTGRVDASQGGKARGPRKGGEVGPGEEVMGGEKGYGDAASPP